jgi:hypothetical protein
MSALGGKRTLQPYAVQMRDLAIWYRNLLLFWAVIGLPGLVLAYGFSGGDFTAPSGDILSVAASLVALSLILSPVILWPWRKRGRTNGFE